MMQWRDAAAAAGGGGGGGGDGGGGGGGQVDTASNGNTAVSIICQRCP